MQKAKFDIGEEAVNRFSLPPEDKATLELAEWVDGTFRKTSVCSYQMLSCMMFFFCVVSYSFDMFQFNLLHHWNCVFFDISVDHDENCFRIDVF